MIAHIPVAMDDFDRANGALGSNWTGSVPVSDLVIASNVVKANTSVDNNVQFWNNGTFSLNQYSQAKVATAPSVTNAWMGVSVRTTATDAIWMQCKSDNSGLELIWYNGGAFTAIGAVYSGGGLANNDIITMEAMAGGMYYGYQNGVLRVSGLDGSTPTTGRPGIVITDATGRLDMFEGGDCLAHLPDTNVRFTGNAAPLTQAYTCGAGATLLVVDIVTLGATDRAGGAPTYNGVALTQVATTQKAASSPEVGAEMWYLLAPPTGSSLTISIPNTGTAKTLYVQASSWKAPAGYTTAFDVGAGANGTSANPSTGAVTTTVDGDIVMGVLASGNNNPPTGRTNFYLNETDTGNQSDNNQYVIPPNKGSISLGWTVTSDDWGAVIGAFKMVGTRRRNMPAWI